MMNAAPASLIPNHAIAKPISASGGTGRRVRTSGAVRSSSTRLQANATPAATPSPVPTAVPGIQWRTLCESAAIMSTDEIFDLGVYDSL